MWTDQEVIVFVSTEYSVVWQETIDFHGILIVLRILDVDKYYPEQSNGEEHLFCEKKTENEEFYQRIPSTDQ